MADNRVHVFDVPKDQTRNVPIGHACSRCLEGDRGFREHHSCQTALIKIIDDWLSAINENKIAVHYIKTFLKLLIWSITVF